MGIFDNMSYGSSPEFASSPQTIQMDFFTDLSPLAGMISANSTTSKVKGNTQSTSKGSMLYDQQVQSDRAGQLLQMQKDQMASYFMNKAKAMVAKDPNMTLSKAVTSLADEMQEASMSLLEKDINHKANVQMHIRNKEKAMADEKDEEKSKQYTLLSLSPQKIKDKNGNDITLSGGEMFLGYDKNGNVTSNQDEIVSLMTNNNYYALMEKGGLLNYGSVYNSPIKIDQKAGDEYARDVMEATKSAKTSRIWETDYSPGEKAQIQFATLYGKLAKSTDAGERTNNFESLTKETDNLLRFMPVESERAFRSEFLKKRTDQVGYSYVRTIPVEAKDKKGNKIIRYKEERVRLKDLSFEEGYRIYITDRIASIAGSHKSVIVRDNDTFQLIDKGNFFGSGNGGDTEYTNLWDRFNKNSNVGAEVKIFAKTTEEGGTGVEAQVAEAYKERLNNFYANVKKYYPNVDPKTLLTPNKINEIEKDAMNKVVRNMPKGSSNKSKEIFGGLVEEVEGKSNKMSVADRFRIFGGDNTPGSANKNIEKKAKAIFTTIPGTLEQWNKGNYGQYVKVVDQLEQVGNAGTGGSIQTDLFMEGMILVPNDIRDRSFNISTKQGFFGVLRINSKGEETNSNITRNSIAVQKDDLPKLKFKYKLNGEEREYSGDEDNVQATIGIKEITKEQLKILKEEATNLGNINGALKIQEAIDKGIKYYQIDRAYVDVSKTGYSYATIAKQAKNLNSETQEDLKSPYKYRINLKQTQKR